MGPEPVDALWGIGKKTAAKLDALGIRTVDELANADEGVLAARFGPNTGPWIRSLGTGEDDGEVTAEPYVRRGQSHERTFQLDLTDHDEIRRETDRIARELAGDLPEGRLVMRVTVKLRTSSFFTSTHGVKLAEPTTDVETDRRGRPRPRSTASSSTARCGCSACVPSSPRGGAETGHGDGRRRRGLRPSGGSGVEG